ncbi:MAG: hypothetical protein ABTA24_00215 [Arthrobacter sp.]
MKAPLVFSAVLAVIAGITTMIFATGGATKELRLDLGLTAMGIAFIASLLISSLLLMTEKPNPDHLSEGSGVHRTSAKIPGGAGSVGAPAPRTAAPGDDAAKSTDEQADGKA